MGKSLAQQLVDEQYAWPGGYPLFAVMADGGCLCKDCVKSEPVTIESAAPSCPDDNQWRITGIQINWEDTATKTLNRRMAMTVKMKRLLM